MKARKSFAFVLALLMILTLVPASAFAATDNTVAKVPAVASDELMPWVTLTSVIKDAAGLSNAAPNNHQVVKFTIENGEWANTDVTATNAVSSVNSASGTTVAEDMHPVVEVIPTISGTGTGSAITPTVVALGDNWIEIDMTVVTAMAKDDYIQFALALKSGEDDGDVKVKVESIDSQISGGTYTVATVAGGDTVATVSDKPVQTARTSNVTAANIEIRETAVNSVDTGAANGQEILLTLPKGVSWNSVMDGTNVAYVTGNMIKTSTTVTTAIENDRDLRITFTAAANAAQREVLVIEPIIDIGKSAKLGDIDVQIRNVNGEIDKATGLTIAEYTEEGLTVTPVKEKDIPTIYAGYEKDGNDNYEVKVTIEESTGNSLISGKYIDFEFPEWVQLVDGETVDAKVNGTLVSGIETGDRDDDTSSFEWAVPVRDGNAGNLKSSTTATNKIEFTIPVTIEAGHSGDLELKVTGAKAGLSDTTLVVAKIVNPVTVSADLTALKTGVQKQAGNKIVITESEAGAIRDDSGKNVLTVKLDTGALTGMEFKDAKATVTAGDLEIKKVDTTGGTITITVDKASAKTAAEITISDIEITLDRTLPEGKYPVKVGGLAIVDNNKVGSVIGYNDDDFTGTSAKADYVNIITAADQAVSAQFVIGSKDYVVNGVTKTMDAEAYIDTAGRTMVPVRYIGDALGLSESQIIWNQATTTATLIGKQVVSVKVGDANLIASGTVIPMDTVAVNLNGRVYVPARFIATALGAQIDWDAAAKTVSIYTVK